MLFFSSFFLIFKLAGTKNNHIVEDGQNDDDPLKGVFVKKKEKSLTNFHQFFPSCQKVFFIELK